MRKLSLRSKLMYIFGGIAALPILIICIYMFYHTENIVRDNTRRMIQTNLQQTDGNIHLAMEAYEDLLYQIYTDDDVVNWMEEINRHEDVPVATNQLRRFLRGLLNTKQYIRSITVIAEDGTVIALDQMAWSTYESIWLENFSLDKQELYDILSGDNYLHIFSTEYGYTFSNEEGYLFHLGHRIIDYKQLSKQCGVVIVSLDEEMLRSILSTESFQEEEKTVAEIPLAFIVDENGRLVAGGDQKQLGMMIWNQKPSDADKEQFYLGYAATQGIQNNPGMSASIYHDENLNWDIVEIIDEAPTLMRLQHNAGITILVGAASLLIVLILIWRISGQLTYYIEYVVLRMKDTTEENMPVHIAVSEDMPLEVETIANQYNQTIEKLEVAIQKEKQEANNRQLAEIRMLEAQINPHFLYNTLDTINWMAIDKDEFDISNAINALATILRYAISDSNKEVTVKDEMDWLKKYIYLQQFRLKHRFVCQVSAAPDVMNYRIHKLLIQPFVENAIVHGFDDKKDEHILRVSVERIENNQQDNLQIIIEDNGRGVDPTFVELVNSGAFLNDGGSHGGIGISNALMRLHAYCGGTEKVWMESERDVKTKVCITFPARAE